MTVLEYRSNAIVDLMQVGDEDCGEQWLKDALQMAVMVELATIPPYACGLWSIKDRTQDKEVYTSIREIMFDEMAHFGRVGNILSAIGGTPVLTDPKKVPQYPGPLPGGVRPELTVSLSGLSRKSAGMYSEIEKPDRPLATATAAPEETYTSIGAFYDKVQRALNANQHLFGQGGGPQIEADQATHGEGNAIEPITEWKTADDVLSLIKEQGEGTPTSPDNTFPDSTGKLVNERAHYYTFLEIHHGRKLIVDAGGDWACEGAEITMPSVYPMAEVPEGGWSQDSRNAPADAVRVVLDDFNAHYSEMLRTFEEAWRTPDGGKRLGIVRSAITHMTSMRALARVLMKIPLPGNAEATYGPEFRYVTQRP